MYFASGVIIGWCHRQHEKPSTCCNEFWYQTRKVHRLRALPTRTSDTSLGFPGPHFWPTGYKFRRFYNNLLGQLRKALYVQLWFYYSKKDADWYWREMCRELWESSFLSPSYKDPCLYSGLIWRIQDNLPISGSFIQSNLKSLLLCPFTYLQAPGIRAWAS